MVLAKNRSVATPKLAFRGGYDRQIIDVITVFVLILLIFVSLGGVSRKAFAESITINGSVTHLKLTDIKREGAQPKIVLYTTMATWCIACRDELPQYSFLHSVFKPEELEIYGLPYDLNDDQAKLIGWVDSFKPSYTLLSALTKGEISSVKAVVLKTLKIDAVPASIITDGNGRILRSRWGPPSVSEIRELIRLQANKM